MHFNLTGLALGVLGLCLIYLPFAYKKARDDGHSQLGAIWSMAALYVVFFLWVVGTASLVRGAGLVIDRSDQFCGSGCIEQGDSHWENPQIALLLLGGSMILAGWYVGKGIEKFDEWLIDRSRAFNAIRQKGTKTAHKGRTTEVAKPDCPTVGQSANGANSHVEMLGLFGIKYSPEVEQNSEYQWHMALSGEYLLLLPNNEALTISQNPLGHYDIKGVVKGTRLEDVEKDLSTAFATADSQLKLFGRSLLEDLRRDGKRKIGRGPITELQRDALAFCIRQRRQEPPDLSNLSEHEAGMILRMFTSGVMIEQDSKKRQQITEDERPFRKVNIGPSARYMIAGVPIAHIPDAVRSYPDFLTWWNKVGRLNPVDHQGWRSISGPGVMLSRTEMIAPQVWDSLPSAERQLIENWAQTIPLGILYD